MIKETVNKKMLMLASVPSMIGQFNMNNIKILREMGYEVLIACNFKDRSVWNENAVEKFKKELTLMKIEMFHIDVSRNMKNIKAHWRTYQQLKALFKREQFEFIHCHTPIVSVLARIAARKLQTKIVYTAHGFHFFKGAPWVNWMIFYPVERWMSRYTDILITINKEDYMRAKTFHAQNVVYIPGVGLDVEHFHLCGKLKEKKRKELGIRNGQLVLLSVGELSARKNHHVIIKALSQIKSPDIIYYIVGSGKLKEAYEILINESGLQNQVKLLGTRSDVDELCGMADIFVHPSIREGLGIAALEGMASGLPLICSNVNGIKDYATDGITGYCVEPYDVEGFVKAILNLKSSSELRKRMGQASYEAAKEFDISKTEEIMKQVYYSIM